MKKSSEVWSVILDSGLIVPGDKVLCAVSGGADSMCMLDILFKHSTKNGFQIAVAHYEHGIRGKESLRDEAFVRSYCEGLKIEFISDHGNVPEYAEKNGLGIEDAARRLRYTFLENAADVLGCNKISTAHNSNDNAETVIFNLARGTGLGGVSGIPPLRGRIIRPLLNMTKAEILKYNHDNGIPFVEDSSNGSDDYTRNRIRHYVCTELELLNSSYARNILRMSELAREDNDYIYSVADDFIRVYSDGNSVDAEKLLSLPYPVASRVIRRMTDSSIDRCHVDAVLKLCSGTEKKAADIRGCRVVFDSGRLFFRFDDLAEIPDRELRIGEETELPETGLVISSCLMDYVSEVYDLLTTCFIKYENISGSVIASTRRTGDSLRIAGRNCTKSLKKLFLENHIDGFERTRIPVIRDDSGILLVRGLALAERAVPEPGDKVLCLVFKSMED